MKFTNTYSCISRGLYHKPWNFQTNSSRNLNNQSWNFHSCWKEAIPKERIVFQPSIFRCKLLVSGSGFHMDVSKNGGTQQPWVFLLNMIILGCFGGTPISGNTHINLHTSSPSKLKSDRRIIPPNAMARRFPREVQHHGLCLPYWLRSFQRTPGTTTLTWKLRKTPGAEGWLYGCGVWCVFFGCVLGCFFLFPGWSFALFFWFWSCKYLRSKINI